ncbi:MAG: PIN domain-containing protein [Solirubrobacteraceae bacterium]
MIRRWTLDTGAVIAYQDQKVWMRDVVAAARRGDAEITIPTTVLVESWRGSTRERGYWTAQLIGVSIIEPLSELLAKRAGELVGRVEGASAVDATVAVSAAQRQQATVLTSDPVDLQRLADDLGTIRVWSPRAL